MNPQVWWFVARSSGIVRVGAAHGGGHLGVAAVDAGLGDAGRGAVGSARRGCSTCTGTSPGSP